MEGYMSSIWGWGSNFAPKDWAYCHGQLLAISQNSALFSLLGTLYGGDGRTSFGLPDLRGRVPVGAGQSPGTTYYQQGAMLGTESVTLTQAEMPVHNHLASFQSSGGISVSASTTGATLAEPANGSVLAKAQAASGGVGVYAPSGTNTDVTLGGVSNNVGGNVTIGNAGGSQPFGILQPLQAIQFIICVQGLYPSRN